MALLALYKYKYIGKLQTELECKRGVIYRGRKVAIQWRQLKERSYYWS